MDGKNERGHWQPPRAMQPHRPQRWHRPSTKGACSEEGGGGAGLSPSRQRTQLPAPERAGNGRFLFPGYLGDGRGERAERPGMERMQVTETFAGIALPGHMHTAESLRFAGGFQFRATDLLIATYPKSGTTWMQEILTLILSKGDPESATTIPNWARAPWLEQTYFRDMLPKTSGPRLITTHLPCQVLAPALRQAKAKVIYVARNPKDVVVSFYHFHKMAKFLPDPGSFEDFLLRFLDGTVQFGSWFQHIKGWLGQQLDLNLFYITYEELHKDLRRSVERLANWLGCPLQPEEIRAIEQHCSFSSMRENAMVNYTLIPCEIMDHSQGKFMRKGMVGDWRDHFSPLQNMLFQKIYQEEMQDSSLCFHWTMD